MNINKIKNDLKKFKKGIVKGLAGAMTIVTIMSLSGCGENKKVEDYDSIFKGEPISQELMDEYNRKNEAKEENKKPSKYVLEHAIVIEEVPVEEEDENINIPLNEIDMEINNLKELLSYKFDESEEIREEEIADRTSLYIEILDAINQDNSLSEYDMEYYMSENYDTLLYSIDFFSKERLEYAALAYKKLQDNNINIMDVLDELENVVVYQMCPLEENIDELFPLLTSTLVDDENLYDIYFPFASQLHMCGCDAKHQIDASTGTFECDELINKIEGHQVKEKMYTPNIF